MLAMVIELALTGHEAASDERLGNVVAAMLSPSRLPPPDAH